MKGCSKIKKRFNFSDPILLFFSHESNVEKDGMPSLLSLMEVLPWITSSDKHQIIEDEYCQLSYFELPADIDMKDTFAIFWAIVMDSRESD